MIPVLMIVHSRLEYTKKALEALFLCKKVIPYIIDNGSDIETFKYLRQMEEFFESPNFIYNSTNYGIAHAMNQFLERTWNYNIVGKADNDTVLPADFIEKMLPHMKFADVVQAKHKLIAASEVGTFDQWVSKMKRITPNLRENNFVGGSGILFKRQLVNKIHQTDNLIMGWRQFQREHPELKKAFATDVEIKLLDEDGYPEEYKGYYQMTGRV